MTSESPDTEREVAEAPPQRIAGPLLFSVVLHGTVLLFLTRTVFSLSTEESSVDERPSVRVALAVRPPPEPAESIPPQPAEVPVPEPVQPAAVPPEPVQSEPVAVAESEPLREEDPEPRATFQPWTPERIRTAIQTSTSELRGTFTGEWMENCILERKERRTRDCEQQLQEPENLSASAIAGRVAGAGSFASITRRQQHRRLSEQFMKDNYTLRELVDADGLVGELASFNYYLNRDYLVYLNGNRVNGDRNDLVFTPMQNFAADVLGGPQLNVAGNVPFSCRSKKLIVRAGHIGDMVPCVYEYTGFEIERPERDPNEFRVVPTVFGP